MLSSDLVNWHYASISQDHFSSNVPKEMKKTRAGGRQNGGKHVNRRENLHPVFQLVGKDQRKFPLLQSGSVVMPWEKLRLQGNVEFFDLSVEGREADLQRLRGDLLIEIIHAENMADILSLEVIHRLLH